MSYIIHDTKLRHGGGTHNLEVEIDGDQAVIRFGSSFTLRLDEQEVNQLTDVLQDTLNEVRDVRRQMKQSCVGRQRAEQRRRQSTEDEMIQAGIDAREVLKASQLDLAQCSEV